MDLNDALEKLKFDPRMKEFNIKQGLITREDVEKNSKNLKDYTGECENITLEDRGDFE